MSGLCVLAVVAQAAAVANGSATASGRTQSAHGSKVAHTRTAEEWLRVKLRAARKYRGTIRFFESYRQLTESKEHRVNALAALRRAHRDLAKVTREAAHYRRVVDVHIEQRRARALAKAPPRTAICEVFGPYCQQAVAVAWCESRLSTTAQNGQYLGLFQMGSNERRLFGHGDTALRPGHRRASLLRELGSGLEPMELQVRRLLATEVFVAKCDVDTPSRVSFRLAFW